MKLVRSIGKTKSSIRLDDDHLLQKVMECGKSGFVGEEESKKLLDILLEKKKPNLKFKV
jgi:hypothetical protein